MQYQRFERLMILVGIILTLSAGAVWAADGFPDPAEVVAYPLLFAVLAAAVHSGQRGGSVAAILASAVYVFLQVPALREADPMGHLLGTVMRLGAFGLVGVVGGELCSRIRYTLAHAEDIPAIDEWSRVFNQHFALRELEKSRDSYVRYHEDFCVLLISPSQALFSGMRPTRQRMLARKVGQLLRSDVRLVDEVARLADGRFLVLLPHTGKAGLEPVSQRLVHALQRLLATREPVRVEGWSAEDDLACIEALIASLGGTPPQAEESGAYRSRAESTSKPAAVSTDSASASSTFSMSTAESPEGLTKQ